MGDSNNRFKHESLQDAKTIKALLTSLASGFSKGDMKLGDDKKEIVLKPDGLMNVRIRAEREDGTSKFSLSVSWSDASDNARSKGTPRVES